MLILQVLRAAATLVLVGIGLPLCAGLTLIGLGKLLQLIGETMKYVGRHYHDD